MAKAGVDKGAVAAMSQAELSAWLDDVLISLGVNVPDEGVIVSRRLRKPES